MHPILRQSTLLLTLEYLWSDVAKFDRNKWFADGIKSLDELVKEYKEKGLEVFVDGIFNK